MTGLLILLPAVWFFFCEFSGLPAGRRALASLFQSVTTRTAGFNTVDVSAMSQTGQMLMIMLMLVGGAPGSTAGGMKITTAAVIVASAAAVFRRRSNAEFFGRRISNEAVRQASAVMLLYILLPVSGAMLIAFYEGVPFMSALFETASAVGTVGWSLGLTPHLVCCRCDTYVSDVFRARGMPDDDLCCVFTEKYRMLAVSGRKNYDRIRYAGTA